MDGVAAPQTACYISPVNNVEDAAEAVPLAGRNQVEPLALPDLRGSQRRRRLVVLGLLLLGGALAFAFWPREQAEDLLRTEPAGKRDVARVISITGHLDARVRMEVPAPTPALLASIDVTTGQRVTEGTQLATLDDRQANLNLGIARAQAGAAGAQLENARVASEAATEERRRVETLLAQGLASEADVAAARAREAQAASSLRAARAQRSGASSSLAQAQLSREFVVLRAPMDGVVLAVPRATGGLVGPERGALFVVGSDLSTMRIDATVGEADIGAVRVGQEATFEVPAYVGRTFRARVTHVVPQGDVAGGTTSYSIQLEAPNPDGALLPGMTTMLTIEVARANDVLTVHEAALRFTPEGAPPAPPRSRVWVRTGPNAAEPVDVRAGVSDGAFTEVTPVEPGTLAPDADVVVGVNLSEASEGSNVSLGARRRRGP